MRENTISINRPRLRAKKMKFWLGVTDNHWFEFLAHRRFEEVNFWQPRPTAAIRNLVPGAPFLFKLKRPNNPIAVGQGDQLLWSFWALGLSRSFPPGRYKKVLEEMLSATHDKPQAV